MIAESPWVRIVIVNYNAGPMLQACVDALATQTMPDFETVIVDNASTVHPISGLRLPDEPFSSSACRRQYRLCRGDKSRRPGQHLPMARNAQP